MSFFTHTRKKQNQSPTETFAILGELVENAAVIPRGWPGRQYEILWSLSMRSANALVVVVLVHPDVMVGRWRQKQWHVPRLLCVVA